MTHMALSDGGDDSRWFSEGCAVYVEGIARTQAGNRTQQDVFAEQIRQMPKGLPQSGDRGLDHTHTWGRTYWGGALFCFLADVEIRRQTQNKKGLQEALRGILNSGGDMRVAWALEKALDVGDEDTGTIIM